jgi:predicted phosphodiesterase
MRIYVISDTHGRDRQGREIYKNLEEIDLIILLAITGTTEKRMREQ